MYNNAVKEQFLEYYINEGHRSRSTAKSARWIFENISPVEEACQKDFSQLDPENMQRAFDLASGLRTSSAELPFFFLRQYVRWCNDHAVSSGASFESLRIDPAVNMRKNMVASPAHLAHCLDAAFPNPEKNSIEYIYRSTFWLSFMGFTVRQAAALKTDEVDLNYQEIHPAHSFEYYQIYDDAKRDLSLACSLQEFIEPRGSGLIKPRAKGNLLLRGKADSKKSLEEYLTTTVRQTARKALAKADRLQNEQRLNGIAADETLSLDISYERVRLSGIFYRAFVRENIGLSPVRDFSAMVEIEVQEKVAADHYTLNANRTPGKIRQKILHHYLTDYLAWKRAFDGFPYMPPRLP